MKSLRSGILILTIASIFSSSGYSSDLPSNNDSDNEKVIVEITDKYNEVRMGVTENSVYMIFSENIKELANDQFEHDYLKETNRFDDSGGKFILDELVRLESNKIEYSLDEIENIFFESGRIEFDYSMRKEIGFEEIQSYKGTRAVDNFYLEDLELLILTYRKQR